MPQSYFDSDQNGHKSFELPGARPHYNPDRPGQVNHIFLDLVLDIPKQRLEGTCAIALTPVRNDIRQFVLDAVNLTIESVQIDGESQPFDCDGEQLQIQLRHPTEAGKEVKIAIAYHVEKPQRGIYFITPTPDYPNKPTQVWTQGEDEDSRFWFPCFDYPGQLASSELRVTVPKPLMAISNGELIGTQETGDRTTYHWLQNHVHP
ncbi:MAG: aminopeptidase, partial [Coleofasciculus sp. C2-GNP5-27]